MAPPLASTGDLATRMGEDIPTSELARAEWLLEFASDRIRARTGRTWLDEDGELVDVPDLARKVAVEMVVRAVTNPEGVTQETTGPFSVSFGSDAAQRIYIAREEREDLRSLSARSGLGVISTTRDPVS